MTTAEHPFRVAGIGWVPAAALQPGQQLVQDNGHTVTVGHVRPTGDSTTVYNFEVEDNHNYFVATGDAMVLVHNSCGDDAAEGAEGWTRVGRWMHPDEHIAMQETGSIQWNSTGTHRVANPATPDAYRAAPRGDIYVDYEVPTSVLRPHSEGTSIIYGPNSLLARLPGRAQPGDVPFRKISDPR